MMAAANPTRAVGVDFLRVDEHVARNPVARAIARPRMLSTVRAFCVRLHMLQDGEDAAGDLHTAAKVLAVAIRIAEARGDTTSGHARVMMGGMSTLVALATRGGAWRVLDATAIDQALVRAIEVYESATAKEVQNAHTWVDSLDRSGRAGS